MTISKKQPMREAEQQLIDDYNKRVPDIENSIAAETKRAQARENELSEALTSEVQRATKAETALTTNLAAEVTRAKGAEKSNSDAITTEKERATAAESTLQININTEYTRANNAETALSNALGTTSTNLTNLINGKFPVTTDNIGDAQVTEAKLASDIQELLTFCKTLPDFEFGYSEAVSIPASSTTSVEITFNKTFAETPQVFTEVMCNTLNNILVAHVTYVDTTKATIKLYNGGVGQVDNVTVDYLALAGR